MSQDSRGFRMGDCFRFVVKRDDHLWMVISDPLKDDSRVLCANVTTLKSYKDHACVLRQGDHSDIDHDSCVYYARSRVFPASHLDSLVASGAVVFRDPLSKGVLKRVQEGALMSTQIPTENHQVLLDQMGPPPQDDFPF